MWSTVFGLPAAMAAWFAAFGALLPGQVAFRGQDEQKGISYLRRRKATTITLFSSSEREAAVAVLTCFVTFVCGNNTFSLSL